ncbi:Helicase SEN1 [Candida viswanathii]|uniref:Helicase SEN1 n=1 Tax=Candida viswanathii TaxID=5486 RepID=A0A367YHY0_9ASCO|nr:Helicase SEN1 [Candida viswanathii]
MADVKDGIHKEVLKLSVAYLNKYKDNPHWFCDEYMQPIASNALILFSLNGTPVIENLKVGMARSLTSCPNCLEGFAEGKAMLRSRFLVQNRTPVPNVNDFLNTISNWEVKSLTPILDELLLLFNSVESHSGALVVCVYWCMTNPDLLRNNPDVREKYGRISQGLQRIDRLPTPQDLLPGLFYVLFEGDTEQQHWGNKWIESLGQNQEYFRQQPLLELVIVEFSKHLYRVQRDGYFSVPYAGKFWDNLDVIIDVVNDEALISRLNAPQDIKVMSEYIKVQFVSLIGVLCKHILSRLATQIPSIFKVFYKLLLRLKAEFWLQAEGFKFELVLNEILGDPEYSKQLLTVPDSEVSTLTAWISPLRESLSALHRVRAATRIGPFFLGQTQVSESIRIQRVNKLHELGCQNLSVAFDDAGLNDIRVYGPDTEIPLHNALELRGKIEYDADAIIRAAISSVGDTASRQLLCQCLYYDMLLLVNSTRILLDGEKLTIFDCFPVLWECVYKLNLRSNVTLVKAVIAGFAPMAQAVMFEEVKADSIMREQIGARKRHNQNMAAITKSQKKIFEFFGLIDQKHIQEIVTDPACAQAIWACIFSPLVSQAALDFINEVYSAGGRLETFRECLSTNLQLSLNAITINVHILTELKSYEPTPKAVRIIMDIIQALADPVDSALTSSNVKCDLELMALWQRTWLFLIMIFTTTPAWSNQYHLERMVEFTRDTLDLCHLLLDSFRVIVDYFETSFNANWLRRFFEVFMEAFPRLISWLRLGDATLLNLCVDLVLKGFDLALEEKFLVDDLIIEEVVKYGNGKKASKLSDPQKSSLLNKAKELNEDIIERFEAADNLKKKQLQITNAPSSSAPASTKPEPTTTATLKSATTTSRPYSVDDSLDEIQEIPAEVFRQKYEQEDVKQQDLTRFFKFAKTAPPAPPPKVVKGTNSIDNLRNKLQQSRSSLSPPPALKFNPAPPRPPGFNHTLAKPPAINPAPPRPAGFNPKKPAHDISVPSKRIKKTTGNGDSSSDEEEPDADFSDLFVEKKKKAPKITQLDLGMRSLEHNAYNKRRKQISEEEQAKERLRLRLNVNLKPLYSHVLKWNYNSSDDYPSRDRHMYQQIKDTYTDVNDYVKVTEPLLMLECWQAMQSAKKTVQEKPFDLLVGTRALVDGFFDVFASMEKAVLQDRKITETDLIVLAIKMEGITNDSEIRDYMKNPDTLTCLAKVREIKYTNNEHCDLTLRVFPSGPMVGALAPKSVVSAMRVMQMVTIEREYSSLKGLQYYDLVDSIILATPNKPIEISDEDAERMRKVYRVNDSQAKAIMGTYKSDGFSLIQGPPGTGKTKTILGIVGYSLSHQRSSKTIDIPGAETSGTPRSTPTPPPPSSSTTQTKGKILICAPSNAAVDELVLRLRDGVINSAGKHMPLNVVRLGRSDAINAAVRDLTLEELVDQRLNESKNDVRIDPNIAKELTRYTNERKELRQKLVTEAISDEEIKKIEDAIKEVLTKRSQLAQQLDQQREKANIAARAKETNRRNIQNQILSEAQVLCATLSGSAHDLVANLAVQFDQVIIDEACQCLELSAIIPLRYGCKKCIMVGDPNQLPPTVLSQAAASYNYEQSLFVRMQKNHPDSIYMLDVQYRMNPMISQFPSAEFYDSKLKDGEGMLELNTRPWHKHDPLTPYRFFDISSKHQKNALTQSLFNRDEAVVALELSEALMKYLPDSEFVGKIGIISPYKEQVRTIKQVFIAKFGKGILNEIDFNTVDGFQGQEKEIIIMSCVRASETGNVGFLSDFRRMNVALTRAKTTLWILGNEDSLRRDPVWNRLLTNATERKCISKAHPGFLADLNKKRKNPDNNNKNQKKKAKHNPKPEAASTGERNVQAIRNNTAKPAPRPTSGGYLPIRNDQAKPAKNEKEPLKNKNDQQKQQKNAPPKKPNSLAVPTKRPRAPKEKKKKGGQQPNQPQEDAPKPYVHQPKPVEPAPQAYAHQPKPQNDSVPGPTRSGTIARPPSVSNNSRGASPAPAPPAQPPARPTQPQGLANNSANSGPAPARKPTPSSSGVVKPPPNLFIPRKRK